MAKKMCATCGRAEAEVYNAKGRHVCRVCLNSYVNLHTDDFEIKEGEIVRVSPYENLSISAQAIRAKDYIYHLYNRELPASSFIMLENYAKTNKYTWLGLVRAAEWFYLVKKNSIKKSKGSVGILPMVYDEAQQFYENENKKLLEQYQRQLASMDRKKQTRVMQARAKRREKKDKFDLEEI